MNDEESDFKERTDSTQNSTQQKKDEIVSPNSGCGCLAPLLIVITLLIILVVAQKCDKKESAMWTKFYAEKERLIVENRIYDSNGITSVSYVDPIHNFFKVQSPLHFKIKPSTKESTFKIPSDSPYSGKVVPASRVTFHNGSDISILARETFVHTLHDDFLVEMNLKLNKQMAKYFRNGQWIQIDGARGTEHILWNKKRVMHMVKYKKNGLDHAIVMNCKTSDFAEEEEKFQAMLKTYQGLSSKD